MLNYIQKLRGVRTSSIYLFVKYNYILISFAIRKLSDNECKYIANLLLTAERENLQMSKVPKGDG